MADNKDVPARPSGHRKMLGRAGEHGLVLLLYALIFLALAWPAPRHFATRIISDAGDGFQMYWNTWWVRTAVLASELDVFETRLLHFPETCSLLTHTLHPFAGFLTVPFAGVLGDVALFNLVVVFAFAFSGWGAYLLAKRVAGPRLAFVGGFVFTFSGYHFAHAEGHLNLVLMQWIPFYMLFFLRLLERRRVVDAILAAVFLFLVLLCDHYYLLMCVFASVLAGIWALSCHRDGLFTRRALGSFSLFAALVLLTSGLLVMAFARASHEAAIVGHNANRYSMDLFALLIPGGHWQFNSLSEWYWNRLLGGRIHGQDVHVGLGALALAVLGYIDLRRRKDRLRFLLMLLATAFFLLALGRDITAFGQTVPFPMPYELLEFLMPIIRLGGVPDRFVVVTILAVSVLSAAGCRLLAESPKGRVVLVALACLVVVELMPRQVTLTPIEFPDHIEFLARRAVSHPGAVLDLQHGRVTSMVHQTRHRQPIQDGYLARTPAAVRERARALRWLLNHGEFAALASKWGFRYVLSTNDIPDSRLLYEGTVNVYEITTYAGAVSSR
jgi:hypothetical protein